MGEGIKSITERVRKEREQSLGRGAGTDVEQPAPNSPPVDEITENGRAELTDLIGQITSAKVSGQTKMLIRFDDKHMPILNMLQPALKVNVVQFVNFSIEYFFEAHPEIKTLMKNAIKNSLKEI